MARVSDPLLLVPVGLKSGPSLSSPSGPSRSSEPKGGAAHQNLIGMLPDGERQGTPQGGGHGVLSSPFCASFFCVLEKSGAFFVI